MSGKMNIELFLVLMRGHTTDVDLPDNLAYQEMNIFMGTILDGRGNISLTSRTGYYGHMLDGCRVQEGYVRSDYGWHKWR